MISGWRNVEVVRLSTESHRFRSRDWRSGGQSDCLTVLSVACNFSGPACRQGAASQVQIPRPVLHGYSLVSRGLVFLQRESRAILVLFQRSYQQFARRYYPIAVHLFLIIARKSEIAKDSRKGVNEVLYLVLALRSSLRVASCLCLPSSLSFCPFVR